MREKHLTIPLRQDDVEMLEVGDIVYLDGPVFTAMTKWHKRTIEQNVAPPFDTRSDCNVIMHVGPAVRQLGSQYTISALSPLVSMMFSRWTPQVLERFGVKAIIGKSGMPPWVAEQGFSRHGAVFLLSIGTWIGAWYASRVEAIRDVFWLDLGLPEATWIMTVKGFGPFLVETDARGRSFYAQANRQINKRLAELLGPSPYQYVMKRIGDVDETADIW
jgi:L(+)-tartrate dehydratase beta subunit